ncbi:MAG: DUF4124 domain-containing protein [Nitrospinaceae bacterium]|jgi:hypothetical protein|nr:MAG: DUF4124 domain-containing protein [Nitrospinaceae bacterium]
MNNLLKFLTPCLLIAALLTLSAHSVEAAMYQWVDKNGKVHYTDHPGNIPMDAIDKNKPIKGVFGTPDPMQYHKNDPASRMQRKKEFQRNVERKRKFRACERSCQRKDMFDTITCVQTHCRGLR